MIAVAVYSFDVNKLIFAFQESHSVTLNSYSSFNSPRLHHAETPYFRAFFDLKIEKIEFWY